MGRIYKQFTVENLLTRGTASAEAKVDSGADVTVVRRDVGEQIGVDIQTALPIAIGGVGGRVLAFEVPAKVTVGRSSAQLRVAVPIGRYDAKARKITPVQQKENLLGHDFLRATRAKLDFSSAPRRRDSRRRLDDAFVEGETRADDVVRLNISRAEVKALEEWVRRQPRRRSQGHSTKKSSGQLDREIAEALANRRGRKAR